MKKLRKGLSFLFLVPYRRCHLYVPLSLENLQQILKDLSITGIEERDSHFFLGSLKILYSVKLINENCFLINGPVGYRRFCLLTKGWIKSSTDINREVILELEMQLASRELLTLSIVWLSYFIFVIFMSIYVSTMWAFFGSIHLLLLAVIWYMGILINFRAESNKIMTVLTNKFQC